jgi:lipopolysaccharide biosynthesis glycosyltransferase
LFIISTNDASRDTIPDTDTIHVVLAIYDPKGTYSRHSGVVMFSLFERTKSRVCVHVLHDQTLTEQNRAFLRETAEMFGQEAAFHDVSSHLDRMGSDAVQFAQKVNSIGALFRLLIPDALSSLEKVIYLDSDVVVNMDIQDLWDVPLEGYSLGGALDRPLSKPYGYFSPNAFRLRRMGCDRKMYINSGVLLMDLSRIRKKYELIPQSVSWLERHKHYSNLVDQHLINSCFRGDIKIIDSRFNNCHAHDDGSNSILHAISVPKPWNGPKGTTLDRLYWKTYFKTPWGRLTPDETADLMLDVIRNSPLTHQKASQCYKKIGFRLRRDLLGREYFVLLWSLLKNGCFRAARHVRK